MTPGTGMTRARSGKKAATCRLQQGLFGTLYGWFLEPCMGPMTFALVSRCYRGFANNNLARRRKSCGHGARGQIRLRLQTSAFLSRFHASSAFLRAVRVVPPPAPPAAAVTEMILASARPCEVFRPVRQAGLSHCKAQELQMPQEKMTLPCKL